MVNKPKKRIKITNRCIANTSRGKVRGPLETPYMEEVDQILLMLSRDNPTPEIVEVLDDGREVLLTINNFADDNSTIATAPVVETVAEPTPVVEEIPPAVETPTEEEATPTEEVTPAEEVVETPVVEEKTTSKKNKNKKNTKAEVETEAISE